ncbi:MAG: hypothetical protein ACJAX5_002155 [Patiriisocius sp.]|jgi:hypothetical protein
MFVKELQAIPVDFNGDPGERCDQVGKVKFDIVE